VDVFKERKAIDTALDDYRTWLDNIPDELFDVTPPQGGWSYAEVYSHILQATIGASIAVERCANGTFKASKKGRTLIGHYVLATGSFPPVKLASPSALASKMPVKKIGKEGAKNMLVKCRRRMETVLPLVQSATADCKAEHPRMGMLNAKQWFKFIRIHLQHHLMQLARIQENLQTG